MDKLKYWIILVGLVIGALAYWNVPYKELQLNNLNMWLFVGSGTFIGGFVLKLVSKKAPINVALFLMLGVITSIVLRIVYDVSLWDSTSHNVAPFEIVLAGLQSFPFALLGAYIAVLIKKL
ncbi:hypothetical protein [Winogradskyella alexanderae]|uniref:Uncharacterized protein n=1 Tax=Winogradskyella alexanderae TaxID=2877123 RepID=A0ABS7XQ47_9FLAO|nr:hypothetical protein [Winogradskyella alexanderae]MCA0132139.1 hypothetical protein [Winogradskyella alexanderae]